MFIERRPKDCACESPTIQIARDRRRPLPSKGRIYYGRLETFNEDDMRPFLLRSFMCLEPGIMFQQR
jgi:hypothetical protein